MITKLGKMLGSQRISAGLNDPTREQHTIVPNSCLTFPKSGVVEVVRSSTIHALGTTVEQLGFHEVSVDLLGDGRCCEWKCAIRLLYMGSDGGCGGCGQ